MQTNKLKLAAQEAEARHILSVLKKCKHNKTIAAAQLGIDRKTLYNKLNLFQDLEDQPEEDKTNIQELILRELIAIRECLQSRTIKNETSKGKRKRENWIDTYKPSTPELERRLNTSLLDQPIEMSDQ